MLAILKQLKKKEGFTLVELMIVVAIIGILAAIAIPQFAAYRVRAANTQGSSTGGVLKSAMAALHSDIACYGISGTNANLTAVAGGNGAGAALLGSAGAIVAATPTTAGAHVTGTNPTTTAISGVGIAIPQGVDAVVSTEGAPNSVYQIVAESMRGNRAYAVDGDIDSQMLFVQNDSWTGQPGFNATIPGVQAGNDEFFGQPGGGLPQANWTLLQ